MENAAVMKEFLEVLNKEPEKAYDFISRNGYRFSKDGLLDIIKETIYSLHHHVGDRYYGDLYKKVLEDAAFELEESYEDAFAEHEQSLNELE